MLNFCLKDIADVSCEKPCCDGYSVKNLINVDKNEGFLVDYFVKPPVDIHLKFSCNLDVKKISLNCVVGSQKTDVVHVLSCKGNNAPSIVGKGALNTSEKYLVFHFRGNKQNHYGKHEEFFNTKNLYNVKHLIVRLIHTESSTVPALGKIEVWGFLSSNVPEAQKRSILSLWQSTQPSKSPGNNISGPSQENKESREKESDIGDQFKIPEEFLDPITCDIFTIPMMLPSGKVVDITTLEKFYRAEERWGRDRSDPFTGVLFTNTCKPVVATSLKEQLDKFLIDHCNNPLLKNVPRTVGSSGTNKNAVKPSENNYYSAINKTSCVVSKKGTRKFHDLDCLLEESLSGLPTFLEKPVLKKPKVECMKCGKCDILFKLICEHFICRNCLVALDKTINNKCTCDKKISFNEILRYHLKG